MDILRLVIHIHDVLGTRIVCEGQPPAVALHYIAVLIGNGCLYNLHFGDIEFKDALLQHFTQFHRIIFFMLLGIQHIPCIIAGIPIRRILNIRRHQLRALLSQQE